MPTNLTQSKKVTLCRNKKKASLFQNCMLGSLQADRFNEWNSLKRNAFHLWLTTLCRRWNWKTILISDHRNDSDTRHFFPVFLSEKQSGLAVHAWKKLRPVGLNLILSATHLPNSIASARLCVSAWYDKQGSSWKPGTSGWISQPSYVSVWWWSSWGLWKRVFDVFLLFHAGLGSPLHALMSWCSVWCWPSNLRWRSGPGVHPSVLPLSRTHTHTQINCAHSWRHALIYIASRSTRCLCLCILLTMKWVECVPVFREQKVKRKNLTACVLIGWH